MSAKAFARSFARIVLAAVFQPKRLAVSLKLLALAQQAAAMFRAVVTSCVLRCLLVMSSRSTGYQPHTMSSSVSNAFSVFMFFS